MFATVPPPPRRLLVFARVPERGKVKTRLAKSVGDERALAVYRAMLADALESIGNSGDGVEVEILWAPTDSANGDALRHAFGDRNLAMQTGAALGERLAMAFAERFFFHRTETIVTVGVDDPLLTRSAIDHAFALLDSCDWVVGPASDGGYYLIGCRADAFDASLFREMEWGSDSVFTTTRERIRGRGACLAVLPIRHDIDVEEDLRRFAAENGDGALQALLRQWGWAA